MATKDRENPSSGEVQDDTPARFQAELEDSKAARRDRRLDAAFAAEQHADIVRQQPLALGSTIGERETDRARWPDILRLTGMMSGFPELSVTHSLSARS